MTTRITAKIWEGEKLCEYKTTVHADVDDRTGRLIGLGLLFDAGHAPSRDACVEVDLVRDPFGSKEAAVRAQGKPRALDEIVTKAGEVGVLALAAAAGVQSVDVRQAVGVAMATRIDHERLVGSANDQAYERRRLAEEVCRRLTSDFGGLSGWDNAIECVMAAGHKFGQVAQDVAAILRLLGWDDSEISAGGGERIASELLARYWIRRDPSTGAASTTSSDVVPSSPGWWWRRVVLDRWDPVHVSVRINGRSAGKLVHGPSEDDVVTGDGRWGGPCLRATEADRKYDKARKVATSGIGGAVADVREFHLAAMEGNPHALLHERTETPALVRAVSRWKLLREESEEYVDATLAGDIGGVLDGLVDMAYIIIGTALLQFGGDRFERAWRAVHESNMAKRWPDGRFHIREDGKIIKPEEWAGPDIAAIVAGDSERRRGDESAKYVKVTFAPAAKATFDVGISTDNLKPPGEC